LRYSYYAVTLGESILRSSTLRKSFSLALSLAIVLASCSVTKAVQAPDGRYYDQIGFQDAYLDIKNNSVVDGSCARGCPDFSKYEITGYDDATKMILIKTPWGHKASYCIKTSDIENKASLIRKATNTRVAYAKCSSPIGWTYVYSMKTECISRDLSIPCDVDVNGSSIRLSGYQAAPAFKLLENGKALDHLDRTYTIMQGKGYVEFKDDVDMNKSTRIVGLVL
jgi:hypothetical protein